MNFNITPSFQFSNTVLADMPAVHVQGGQATIAAILACDSFEAAEDGNLELTVARKGNDIVALVFGDNRSGMVTIQPASPSALKTAARMSSKLRDVTKFKGALLEQVVELNDRINYRNCGGVSIDTDNIHCV